jgi:hypothetical protein
MSRIYFLLYFAFLCCSVKAQNIQRSLNYPMYENDHFYNDPWLHYLNSEGKKIKNVTFQSSKHPKDENYIVLDSTGLILERKVTDRRSFGPFKSKSFFFHKHTYENSQLVQTEYFDKNGKQESLTAYEYAFWRKAKHIATFKNGRKKNESFTDYNSDTTVKEYKAYKIKHGEQKLSVRYEYDYYPGKQQKETRQFNKKNKLKYTWKYDCNPKGEAVKKETQVCVNSGLDSRGRTVEVTFSVNDKGKKTKYVHTYYMVNGKKRTVYIENYIIKKGKEIKSSDTHFADSVEMYYHYKSYDKKGRLYFERKEEYSTYTAKEKRMKKESYAIHNKGKVTVRQEVTYNDKGLPLTTEVFDKKNKCFGKAVFSYNNEDSYEVRHYNKKGKLTEVYSGKVSYF